MTELPSDIPPHTAHRRPNKTQKTLEAPGMPGTAVRHHCYLHIYHHRLTTSQSRLQVQHHHPSTLGGGGDDENTPLTPITSQQNHSHDAEVLWRAHALRTTPHRHPSHTAPQLTLHHLTQRTHRFLHLAPQHIRRTHRSPCGHC